MPANFQRPDYEADAAPEGGFDAWSLSSMTALRPRGSKKVASFKRKPASIELRVTDDSVWTVLEWPQDASLTLRSAYWPGRGLEAGDVDKGDGKVTLELEAPHVTFRFALEMLEAPFPLIRATTWLTSEIPLQPPFWPRDLLPLDGDHGPVGAEGVVYALQRESATGLVYASITKPGQGTFLYVQNFTSLNDYCEQTHTNLQMAVAGSWPSLGFSLPPAEERPLPAGEEIVVSDALVALSEGVPENEGERARTFLDQIAAIYPHLEQPEVERRDWPARAEQTLKELEEVDELKVEKPEGCYIRPYVGAEVPDSMVQLAVLLPGLDYSEWRGDDAPPELLDRLRDSTLLFIDENVGSIVRYLPDVAEEGEAVDGDRTRRTIDAWYLYHPMMQLANLAERGDEAKRDLFLRSLEYGIKVAHHFDYEWPVKFNVITLEPTVEDRYTVRPARLGQTDVPGLYAYTMLDAHDLTGEQRYLDEASNAVRRMKGLGFEVGYQYNNVAWGVAAAVRLWQRFNDDVYLDRAQVLMAALIHNTQLWEAKFDYGKYYPNFMGLNCLHDASYSAPLEEFETFLALHEILKAGGDDLPASMRMLGAEYCRHLLNRGWFYYPSELPEEAIAEEQRQGYIDRSLSMPLEDLHIDGEKMGQVGQEVYGCGMAFIFTTRAYIRLEDADAMFYCDYPVLDAQIDQGRALLKIGGHESRSCRVEVVGGVSSLKPKISIARPGGEEPEPLKPLDKEGRSFSIPGGSHVIMSW